MSKAAMQQALKVLRLSKVYVAASAYKCQEKQFDANEHREFLDEISAAISSLREAMEKEEAASKSESAGIDWPGDAAWAAAKRLSNKSEQDFVRGAQWALQREASKANSAKKPDARIRAAMPASPQQGESS